MFMIFYLFKKKQTKEKSKIWKKKKNNMFLHKILCTCPLTDRTTKHICQNANIWTLRQTNSWPDVMSATQKHFLRWFLFFNCHNFVGHAHTHTCLPIHSCVPGKRKPISFPNHYPQPRPPSYGRPSAQSTVSIKETATTKIWFLSDNKNPRKMM